MSNPGIFSTESPGTALALPRHRCHAPDCEVEVHPRLLMCYAHWRLVPQRLKKKVWDEYRPGQEIRKDPSEAYLKAAFAAIQSVVRQIAAKEGRLEDDR
jgi:hypothetical protein